MRAILVSIFMAMLDCWSNVHYSHSVFRFTEAKLSDGGTTLSAGPGYTLVFWRRMDGSAYGPEIWFWFTPFRLDAAHRGIQIHWVWNASS